MPIVSKPIVSTIFGVEVAVLGARADAPATLCNRGCKPPVLCDPGCNLCNPGCNPVPQVPFFAFHDWRAAFERLGVTIDRDAYEQINLIEQDAAKQASDAGAGQREDRHDGAAAADGAAAGVAAGVAAGAAAGGGAAGEAGEQHDPQHVPSAARSKGAKRAAPRAGGADAKARRA